jgi:hypothetical protein
MRRTLQQTGCLATTERIRTGYSSSHRRQRRTARAAAAFAADAGFEQQLNTTDAAVEQRPRSRHGEAN